MPNEERKAYSDAVQRLQSTPSILDPDKYPGAKTLYDDFVAQHIEQSNVIHSTVCVNKPCSHLWRAYS